MYSCTDSEIREIRFEEDRGHNLRLILREDTLFILSDSGNIREYNINSNTIAACSKNYASELRNYIDKFKTGSNCTKYQRGFILCENGGNCFVKVDVINETSRMYAAPCDDLRMVYLFAGRYWFLKNHSFNAAAWDGRSTCVKEYQCVHNEWINRNHFFPYADMVNSGGDLYIVNHYAALAMKVNEKTSSLIPAYGQESRQCPANDNPYGGLYGRCAEYGDCLYFFPCQSRDIVRISKKDGQIKYVLSYADINKDYMKQIDIMFEGDILVDEEVTVADWPLRCLVREQTPDETLL